MTTPNDSGDMSNAGIGTLTEERTHDTTHKFSDPTSFSNLSFSSSYYIGTVPGRAYLALKKKIYFCTPLLNR